TYTRRTDSADSETATSFASDVAVNVPVTAAFAVCARYDSVIVHAPPAVSGTGQLFAKIVKPPVTVSAPSVMSEALLFSTSTSCLDATPVSASPKSSTVTFAINPPDGVTAWPCTGSAGSRPAPVMWNVASRSPAAVGSYVSATKQ